MDITDLPDLTSIIRRTRRNVELTRYASRQYAILMANEDPLGREHDSHHPRMSDFGACSLRYVTENLGMWDIEEPFDDEWIKDAGTVIGAWFGCLLKAGLECGLFYDKYRVDVHLEVVVEYDGVPGHIDALCEFVGELGNIVCALPVEVKTTPSSGALQPPDVRKIYQAKQAAGYGLSVKAPFFGVLSAGYNVGNDKDKNPHPKLRHDWYTTEQYKPIVDEEIARLRNLLLITTDTFVANREGLADNQAFCGSCRYSDCEFNKNPMRSVFA